MAVKDYSTTPSLNTAISGIACAPNMPRENVDNAIRQMMADIRSRFLESVSVKDYGATGDGSTDDTTAINLAIDSGKSVHFPKGTYVYTPSGKQLNAGQILSGEGALTTTINKVANGDMFTMASGSGLHRIGLVGNGSTFTGRGLVVSASSVSEVTLLFAQILDMESYCLEISAADSGSELQVFGGIYNRTDLDECAFKLPTDTIASPRMFVGVKSGGFLIDTGGAENTLISACYFRNLVVGSASKKVAVVGSRISSITVDIEINGTNQCFIGNECAGRLVIKSGTIASVVRGNVAFLGLVDESGATGSDANEVDISPGSYTPSWTAASVNPAIGDGTIAGAYSVNGRLVHVVVEITMGSTTTFGTGQMRISAPFAPRDAGAIGQLALYDSSGALVISGLARPQSGAVFNLYDRDGAAVTATAPFTWASGDKLTMVLDYHK